MGYTNPLAEQLLQTMIDDVNKGIDDGLSVWDILTVLGPLIETVIKKIKPENKQEYVASIVCAKLMANYDAKAAEIVKDFIKGSEKYEH